MRRWGLLRSLWLLHHSNFKASASSQEMITMTMTHTSDLYSEFTLWASVMDFGGNLLNCSAAQNKKSMLWSFVFPCNIWPLFAISLYFLWPIEADWVHYETISFISWWLMGDGYRLSWYSCCIYRHITVWMCLCSEVTRLWCLITHLARTIAATTPAARAQPGLRRYVFKSQSSVRAGRVSVGDSLFLCPELTSPTRCE